MGRIAQLVARALVALCLATCVSGVATARAATGGQTIAAAPGVKLNAANRGSLYDGAFYSGYSVAFWTASFSEGDHITLRTTSSGADTPPCQILYMPGTDDTNVSATTPVLEPASATRDGSSDEQRWVATQTGSYVLAMTNADIFLSGPHQCLDAPAGRPFTFTVNVARRGGGGGARSDTSDGPGDQDVGGGASGRASTHVVEPGQSLWVIARDLVRNPASITQVAFEVGRLWHLNAGRIGTGDPDLIYAGQELRLK
jgi:LysM domain